MRVILDASVIVAAAAARGLCEAIFELCLERHGLILCEGILREVEEKLRARIKVFPSILAEYLKFLRANAEILKPEDVPKTACRDAADLMILGLVAAGRADVIVTGDNDLLVVKKYKQTRLMSPRSFWEINKKGE